MTQYTSIRQRIIDANAKQYEIISHLRALGPAALISQSARLYPHLSKSELIRQAEFDMTSAAIAANTARLCKTVVFASEQANVFSELIAKGRTVPLDYRLPFRDVLLQFTSSVKISKYDNGDDLIAIGLMLTQIESTREEYEREAQRVRKADEALGMQSYLPSIEWQDDSIIVFNQVIVVTNDFAPIRIIWNSSLQEIISINPDGSLCIENAMETDIRNLAVSCIGYINCENIFLHQEGGAPEAVNRKRERQGKKVLEPYYVCRIKGVQYDSNGRATGEGAHHGFRYDVRGHFRKLTKGENAGKTTWVRPHQRGVNNELYIPKTYVVAKEPA